MRKLRLEELNRLSVDAFKKKEKIPVVVVLDNIRSMNNIGAVFRTSDAFSIQKIYLCGITAKPPNKEIRKTAIGATESVEWEYNNDVMSIVSQLKQEAFHVISIEQTTTSIALNEFEPVKNEKYAIVLGNEVSGVQNSVIKVSDYCIEIPQSGTKHSLNVSVCGGIILWHFAQIYH